MTHHGRQVFLIRKWSRRIGHMLLVDLGFVPDDPLRRSFDISHTRIVDSTLSVDTSRVESRTVELVEHATVGRSV